MQKDQLSQQCDPKRKSIFQPKELKKIKPIRSNKVSKEEGYIEELQEININYNPLTSSRRVAKTTSHSVESPKI